MTDLFAVYGIVNTGCRIEEQTPRISWLGGLEILREAVTIAGVLRIGVLCYAASCDSTFIRLDFQLFS